MTLETPSLSLGFPCTSMGGGGGWDGMAHFVSTEKPSMAATHKHPVKKSELYLKHIRILTTS